VRSQGQVAPRPTKLGQCSGLYNLWLEQGVNETAACAFTRVPTRGSQKLLKEPSGALPCINVYLLEAIATPGHTRSLVDTKTHYLGRDLMPIEGEHYCPRVCFATAMLSLHRESLSTCSDGLSVVLPLAKNVNASRPRTCGLGILPFRCTLVHATCGHIRYLIYPSSSSESFCDPAHPSDVT
jgi:hypothetical protein